MPLHHRGYGAYLSCNGEELRAYKTRIVDDKVVSCYVESEAGKEFRVHWIDSKPPSHLSVEISMDGRRMGVLSHLKQSSKTSNGGFRIALDAHCPYQFAPLETTDEDVLPSAYSEELGTIEVKLRRVRDFISVPFTPKSQTRPGPTVTSINEHHKKGAGPSHCVSLGKTRDVKAKSTILRPILIDDKPYVTFRFFYRPRAYLEKNGIIPSISRSRSSSAPSSSISSAGQRRKRRPREVESSYGEHPPVAKRRRTAFQDDTPDDSNFQEDGGTPDDFMYAQDQEMNDESDNKENVVEVRLSSKDHYAIPGSSASCSRQARVPSVKRELSPDALAATGVIDSMKREPTPVTEIRLSSKDAYAIPSTHPDQVWVKRELSDSVKTESSPSAPVPLVKRESTPVTEVHLSSHNNYCIPRASCSPVRPVKLKEHRRIKAEPSENASPNELPLMSGKEEDIDDWEEETLVELHLSSHIMHKENTRATSS